MSAWRWSRVTASGSQTIYGRCSSATAPPCAWPTDARVYFNNDPLGCAVRDASRFAGSLRAAGLEPSRVGG